MKKFTQIITMKVTHEQFKKDLRQHLLDLGYKDITSLWESNNKFLTLNGGGFNGCVDNYSNASYRRLITAYNPELFLALAAMTEGEDWIVGEWLKCEDSITWSKEPIFEVKHLKGCNDSLGYACNGHKDYFKKATKEELIKHFTKEEMNTATKEGGERFPFELGETDAKRIINIACGEWQQKLAKMWGYELLIDSSVEITEGFYKEMRNACTPSQNLLFDEIFGEDEKGYQVGDCVITEGYSDVYDGRVLKIKEIDNSFVYFTVLDYGYFNISNIFSIGRIKRKATEEEIEKAQIIPEGTPCLVRRQGHFLPNSYRLRYADGKGGFYMNGNKKGDTGGWDVVHLLNDLNNLPELK